MGFNDNWDAVYTENILAVVCVSVSIFNKFNILSAVPKKSIINVCAILKDWTCVVNFQTHF